MALEDEGAVVELETIKEVDNVHGSQIQARLVAGPLIFL